VVIATKFGFRFKDGKQVGTERASRPENIRERVEGSLRAGWAPSISISSTNIALIQLCPLREWPDGR